MKHFKILIAVVLMSACAPCWAQTDALVKVKLFFIQSKYVQAIDECTSVIGAHSGDAALVAEANYWTAASYVNLFDFLTAKRNFKAIVDKYKGAPYYEDAYLGWGDVEFLQENYPQALAVYTAFLSASPSKKRLATLYFRLAEIHLKLGNKDSFRKFCALLEREFPQAFETRDARRLEKSDQFYTVQVGAFTSYDNAEKFIAELRRKGYEVYSVICLLSGKKLCRVRIGKFQSEAEAEALKRKLEQVGYFAKVFPG